MLAPVRSASSIDRPVTTEVSAAEKDTPAAPAASAAVQQVQAAGLPSPLAGKINILLLAARTQMIEALLDVLATLSKSLGMTQKDGETDVAFASRLADAIESLPPGKKPILDLPAIANKPALPLKLFAQALADPGGAQAQQVITYLEAAKAAAQIVPQPVLIDAADDPHDAAPGVVVPPASDEAGAPLEADISQSAQDDGVPVPAKQVDAFSSKVALLEPNAAGQARDNEPAPALSSPAVPKQVSASLPADQSQRAQSAPTPNLVSAANQLIAMPDPASDEALKPLSATMPLPSDDQSDRQPTISVPERWPGIAAAFSRFSVEQIASLIGTRTLKLLFEGGVPLRDEEAFVQVEKALQVALAEDGSTAPPILKDQARTNDLPVRAQAAMEAQKQSPAENGSREQSVTLLGAQAALVPVHAVRLPDPVAYFPHPYPFAPAGPPDEDHDAFYREDHYSGQHQDEEPHDPDGEEASRDGAEPDDGETPVGAQERVQASPPDNAGDASGFYQRMAGLE